MNLTAVRAATTGGTERVCLVVGAGLIVSGLVHLGLLVAGDGPWIGPVSWRKPTTFGLSFGLTLLTVVWVSAYLPLSARRRAVLRGVFAVDCCVEVGGITLQAWRHVPSHVNRETPVDSAVSTVLADGGGVLVLPAPAWLLTFTAWDESRRTRIVTLAVVAYGLTIAAALAYPPARP